jgi:AcrR family transcriptional regulator
MRKIREALRLRSKGLSTREIAASLGVGQTTVSEYLKRAARAGLVWPLPEALTDATLEAMLFQPMGGATRQVHAQPDWPTIHRELRRKDVTLALVWEEYRASHPDGYSYSRVCELYRLREGRLAPTMRQHHVAGERMFVDYAGATLPVDDAATGNVRQAQLFVAVLGAPNDTFAEAICVRRSGVPRAAAADGVRDPDLLVQCRQSALRRAPPPARCRPPFASATGGKCPGLPEQRGQRVPTRRVLRPDLDHVVVDQPTHEAAAPGPDIDLDAVLLHIRRRL